HGELRGGGAAPQQVADARVLVVLEHELREGLVLLGRRGCVLDRVDVPGRGVRGGGGVLSGHRGFGYGRHEVLGGAGPTGTARAASLRGVAGVGRPGAHGYTDTAAAGAEADGSAQPFPTRFVSQRERCSRYGRDFSSSWTE